MVFGSSSAVLVLLSFVLGYRLLESENCAAANELRDVKLTKPCLSRHDAEGLGISEFVIS